jgi:hypothetical protein
MTSAEEKTLNFDHYDRAYANDPYPVLEQLRSRCPIAHSDAHGGFWIATKYDDIREITQDTETFSSRYSSVPKDIGFGDFTVPPLHLDPPEHARSKRLLATAFVPKKVAEFEESTRQQVVELLDELSQKDSFDLSYGFARLVPTAVVCRLVGRPDMVEQFSEWVQRLLEQAAHNIEDAQLAGFEMFTFLAELVAERRAAPGPDLVSFLTQAEVDGDTLSDEEIVYTAVLLVLAGIDTAWSTLASAIHYLATHPDQQARLRESPLLIPTAREEFLRAFAPVTVGRLVKDDVEFRGCPMRKDEMVLVSFPSANRDEDQFPDAGEVQLDRQPNRHLAFGSGIHRCLGVNVARMELSIALEELLRRVPPFTLADPDVHWTTGQVRGPKHVVVTTTT